MQWIMERDDGLGRGVSICLDVEDDILDGSPLSITARPGDIGCQESDRNRD